MEFPVDVFLDPIVKALSARRSLILRAEPGAGKTTRVPLHLLSQFPGKIYVLEPRRLAAQLSANFVSQSLGEQVGQTVGYQFRFENKTSAQTRLVYMTEGIFLRHLENNPTLQGVSVVILDEFHERNIFTDIAFMLLKRIERSDLKMLIMSATMDVDLLKTSLNDIGTSVLDVPGRCYPVKTEFLPQRDDRPVASLLRWSCEKYQQQLTGDTLIFLPGQFEIRRAAEALSAWIRDRDEELCLLYGDLPASEQEKCFHDSGKKKWILSTNIAETSLTFPRVKSVIDSGLARKASFSPWTQMSRLRTEDISRASCEQRTGRAGRLSEGFCLRLFTKQNYDLRKAYEDPDLLQVDWVAHLLPVLLISGAKSMNEFMRLPWLEPPSEKLLKPAYELLMHLGALGTQGTLTEYGKSLATVPAHPRLANLLLKSKEFALGQAMSYAAAAMHVGWRLSERYAKQSLDCDLWDHLDEIRKDHQVQKTAQQFQKYSGNELSKDEERFRKILLSSYSDLVAKRTKPGGVDFLMCGGSRAVQAEYSGVKNAEYVLALDLDEQKMASSSRVNMRLASAIEQDWLWDYGVSTTESFVWEENRQAVVRREQIRFSSLVLEEASVTAPVCPEASQILFEQLKKRWPAPFEQKDVEIFENFIARVRLVASFVDLKNYQKSQNEIREDFLKALSAQASSFKQLVELGLNAVENALFDYEFLKKLGQMAPEFILAPKSAKRIRIHYPENLQPQVEIRIQEIFGLVEVPSIANNSVPLTFHLLAPNQRPVQVTRDLKSFWSQHYPTIRKELSRKYPRHPWPEDPLA